MSGVGSSLDFVKETLDASGVYAQLQVKIWSMDDDVQSLREYRFGNRYFRSRGKISEPAMLGSAGKFKLIKLASFFSWLQFSLVYVRPVTN